MTMKMIMNNAPPIAMPIIVVWLMDTPPVGENSPAVGEWRICDVLCNFLRYYYIAVWSNICELSAYVIMTSQKDL